MDRFLLVQQNSGLCSRLHCQRIHPSNEVANTYPTALPTQLSFIMLAFDRRSS
jgi:hypothetical protein